MCRFLGSNAGQSPFLRLLKLEVKFKHSDKGCVRTDHVSADKSIDFELLNLKKWGGCTQMVCQELQEKEFRSAVLNDQQEKLYGSLRC